MPCVETKNRSEVSAEAGFSLVEIVVAMTLLATGIIGVYSLMASNNELFEQNSVRGQLLIAANGILDDIDMRHVAGESGSNLTSLSPSDWSTFLSENGIDESDVVLSFMDLSGLATYQLSSYTAASRTLVITSTTPGIALPQEGEVFQIDAGKYLCDVETVSGTAGNLTLVHSTGCSLDGLTLSSNDISFGAYRVSLTVAGRNGVTLTRTRQLLTNW